jgi:hypothetical protein
MKKFIGVVVGLVLLFSGVSHQLAGYVTPALFAQQDPATIVVYVTKTGEKYHRNACRYLSRSKIASSLKDAVARGLGACSVCKPPTIAPAK